jgi:Icc-related predicted phosphoesterase
VKKIIHISDWHCLDTREWCANIETIQRKHGDDADVIVVSGDMLFNTKAWRDRELEVEAAFQRDAWERWAKALKDFYPQTPIVAVPGNHDFCDYAIEDLVTSIDVGAKTFNAGGLKFTGFRGVPFWKGYWHEEISDRLMESYCRLLDPTADILLTHTPPFGILAGSHQIHYGSKPLSEWLQTCNVKAHLFGHAHEGYGLYVDNGRIYSNAATGFQCIEV